MRSPRIAVTMAICGEVARRCWVWRRKALPGKARLGMAMLCADRPGKALSGAAMSGRALQGEARLGEA